MGWPDGGLSFGFFEPFFFFCLNIDVWSWLELAIETIEGGFIPDDPGKKQKKYIFINGVD